MTWHLVEEKMWMLCLVIWLRITCDSLEEWKLKRKTLEVSDRVLKQVRIFGTLCFLYVVFKLFVWWACCHMQFLHCFYTVHMLFICCLHTVHILFICCSFTTANKLLVRCLNWSVHCSCALSILFIQLFICFHTLFIFYMLYLGWRISWLKDILVDGYLGW